MQILGDIISIQDFRLDKSFILPKVLWMNSTFINMLLISLVLFGLLQNWRLDFTNCCNVRKKNREFSCLPLQWTEVYYFFSSLPTIYLSTRMFFTGLSNYLPNCVVGTSSKDVSSSCSSWGWQYCIFPANSPLPALSLFVSPVRINEYLLCI